MDAQQNITCKGCSKILSQVQVLRHISHSKCKSVYSDHEISAFKTAATARKNEKKKLAYDPSKRSERHQKARNKLMEKDLSKDQPVGKMVKCKVCKGKFEKKSILKHISKSASCKDTYYQGKTSIVNKAKRSAKYYQEVKLKKAEEYSSKKAAKEQEMVNEKPNIERVICMICNRHFELKTILKHIAKSTKCNKIYNLPSAKSDLKMIKKKVKKHYKANRKYDPKKRKEKYKVEKQKEELRKEEEFKQTRIDELASFLKDVEERARDTNLTGRKWLKRCFKEVFERFKEFNEEIKEKVKNCEIAIEDTFETFEEEINVMVDVAKDFEDSKEIYFYFSEYIVGRHAHTYGKPLKDQNKIKLEWHDLKQHIDISLQEIAKKIDQPYENTPWHSCLCNICNIYRDWNTELTYSPPRFSSDQDPEMLL